MIVNDAVNNRLTPYHGSINFLNVGVVSVPRYVVGSVDGPTHVIRDVFTTREEDNLIIVWYLVHCVNFIEAFRKVRKSFAYFHGKLFIKFELRVEPPYVASFKHVNTSF